MTKRSMPLSSFVEARLEKGQNTFSSQQAMTSTGLKAPAFWSALWRLKQKKHVISPVRNFHVIVPAGYRSANHVPPQNYIDALMKFWNLNYYIGLLSAAAYHEATHQAVQVLQVVLEKAHVPIEFGRTKIQFVGKKDLRKTRIIQITGEYSYLPISSPEDTFFDMLRYPSVCGGVNHIATIFLEMAPSIEKPLFARRLTKEDEVSSIRRAGYLLDFLKLDSYSRIVAKELKKRRNVNTYTKLDSTLPMKGSKRNEKWKLWVNTIIEPDNV